MIVRDIMTTKVITIEPGETLGHAANLLRQHQFHHLPVARVVTRETEPSTEYSVHQTALVFDGLLTSGDIDLAAARSRQGSSSQVLHRPWQEQCVMEVMQRETPCVMPTTSIGAAAQLLVERGLSGFPVIEYSQKEQREKPFLVGLLTRSDLLLALARAMGTYEPGMQMDIDLQHGNFTTLIETLNIAASLNVQVSSVIAAPLDDGMPRIATLHVATINPAPFLLRLQEAGIHFFCGVNMGEGIEEYRGEKTTTLRPWASSTIPIKKPSTEV